MHEVQRNRVSMVPDLRQPNEPSHSHRQIIVFDERRTKQVDLEHPTQRIRHPRLR